MTAPAQGPFTNELAPNTPDNHQGRLAWLPDQLLPPALTAPIFQEVAETSLVARLGRTIPVTYGGAIWPQTLKRPEAGQVGTGTSFADREGHLKPLDGYEFGTEQIAPIKLAVIVTVSREYQAMDVNGMYSQIQGDLVAAIGRAVDMAVFHGVQPINGQPFQGINPNHVLANTPNDVQLTPEDGDAFQDQLLQMYDLAAANGEFSDWASDTRFRVANARANRVEGQPVNLSSNAGDLLGLPVEYGRAVSGQVGQAPDTNTRLFGGSFESDLVYGFADTITVRQSEEATLTDSNGQTVNLWQTNQIGLLCEVTFAWAVRDLNAFSQGLITPPAPAA